MSRKKKGAAAWLRLPEKKQAAVLFHLRRQGGNYVHAADALEQLPELWRIRILLAAALTGAPFHVSCCSDCPYRDPVDSYCGKYGRTTANQDDRPSWCTARTDLTGLEIMFSERTQPAEPAAVASEELPELPPELVTYWRKLTARQQNNLLGLIKPLTIDEE